MDTRHIQSLVLRAPAGRAVAQQLLHVPGGAGREAAQRLADLPVSFGVAAAPGPCVTVGLTFAGLEALGLPNGYLRVFRTLANAFSLGAERRSAFTGDSGASAAGRWHPAFRQDRAHVLVSWHGATEDEVCDRAARFASRWPGGEQTVFPGRRLGAPPGEDGEWVHFGLRDGITEVSIDHELPRPEVPDPRPHAPGALLLAEVNDAGFNSFPVFRAPDKVRAFFRDSSFGALRDMALDVAAFHSQVARWAAAVPSNVPDAEAFVKAKLSGRWPDGRVLAPGAVAPDGGYTLDLSKDPAGTGCPFGSHVRRMRAAPDGHGNALPRPLQRRGMPYGPAAWTLSEDDGQARGHLGQFFCASLEDQFEHLLGQWAAKPVLGHAPLDRALDPLCGPHADPRADLEVPMADGTVQRLGGFRPWTTTKGMAYTWHPGRVGWAALLADDVVKAEHDLPWV